MEEVLSNDNYYPIHLSDMFLVINALINRLKGTEIFSFPQDN